MLRVRSVAWFVTGAMLASAVTLVFVNAWRVDAAPGDSDSTYSPIVPCRLADTRPEPNRVGPAATLGAGETETFDAHGTNGECIIPAEAVGLSLNVTALNASTLGFLTVWPDGERPLAASLNPSPGEPPTPNAVTTSLSSSGSFNIYNFVGTVDVVVDVVGYYTPSSLAQLAADVASLEADVASLEADVASLDSSLAILDDSMPFAASFSDNDFIEIGEADNFGIITGAHTELARVTMQVPTDGTISANFSGRTSTTVAPPSDTQFQCHLNDVDDSGELFLTDAFTVYFVVDSTTDEVPISVTRGFDVAAGETITIYMFCRVTSDASPPSSVGLRDLTAIFTPEP